MIKSASASGANTVLACEAAAASSTTAMIPTAIFNARFFPQQRNARGRRRRTALQLAGLNDTFLCILIAQHGRARIG
jgi:hypothetical protein